MIDEMFLGSCFMVAKVLVGVLYGKGKIINVLNRGKKFLSAESNVMRKTLAIQQQFKNSKANNLIGRQ